MSYLCLYTEKGGKESCNSDSCKILGGEVPVESLELVEGQHDAQKVDQDPEGIEDVMTIWTLRVELYNWESNKPKGIKVAKEDLRLISLMVNELDGW